MSKKDFVTFARMIRAQRHHAKLLTPDESRNDWIVLSAKNRVIDSIVAELCNIFQQDNAQFNREKFLQACEIKES